MCEYTEFETCDRINQSNLGIKNIPAFVFAFVVCTNTITITITITINYYGCVWCVRSMRGVIVCDLYVVI